MGAYLTSTQNPHQIWTVDDALTGQVPLPQKATCICPSRSCVDTKLKGDRQNITPFIKLMIQLGDNRRESRRVEGGSGAPSIEQLMDSIQKATHANTGEEIKSRLLLLVICGMCVIRSRQWNGRLDACDA